MLAYHNFMHLLWLGIHMLEVWIDALSCWLQGFRLLMPHHSSCFSLELIAKDTQGRLAAWQASHVCNASVYIGSVARIVAQLSPNFLFRSAQ